MYHGCFKGCGTPEAGVLTTDNLFDPLNTVKFYFLYPVAQDLMGYKQIMVFMGYMLSCV